ncbi:MAG: hypothetical protein JWO96_350 [Candidatus Saccharibacteria bacterium]|nr:hypothetical protein [Candidatus Saccharibacteria bacterium]
MIVIELLVLLLVILFIVFVFVVFFGAPYVPTLAEQRKNALNLLNLKKGQTLYELGSGDGSLLLDAAARGLNTVGYELNPVLVLISRWRGRHYRDQIKVVWGNFWNADFSRADAIFVFQMDYSMKKLEAKIKKETEGKPFRVASNAFKIPGKKPAKKSGAVFLYTYP